jgi:hypothetical protein
MLDQDRGIAPEPLTPPTRGPDPAPSTTRPVSETSAGRSSRSHGLTAVVAVAALSALLASGGTAALVTGPLGVGTGDAAVSGNAAPAAVARGGAKRRPPRSSRS